MEPIPVYLREKMVQAVKQGATKAEVARRFCVSPTVVGEFVQLADAGESLEPKAHAGGPEPTLTDADRERLVEAVDEHPDATLKELAAMCDLEVSGSTMSRELAQLDRSRKRKVPRARSRRSACKGLAASGGQQPATSMRNALYLWMKRGLRPT